MKTELKNCLSLYKIFYSCGKFCDRLAVFSDCTIKELGTHDELVHKPGGIYAEMFAAQAQYYV